MVRPAEWLSRSFDWQRGNAVHDRQHTATFRVGRKIVNCIRRSGRHNRDLHALWQEDIALKGYNAIVNTTGNDHNNSLAESGPERKAARRCD